MAVTETKLGELGVVLGGEQVETGETYEVRSPYDGARRRARAPGGAG